MNRRKNQSSGRNNNFQKNKKTRNFGESKKQNKGIQCRECEGFGHIQSECANTLKKKGKSFNTTQSDEESEGSEEEDDHVNNYIAFQVTSKKDVSASVTIDAAKSKTTNSDCDAVAVSDPESDLDSSDGEEPNTEDIQEAYQIIYENWLKVWKTNKALKEKVAELTKEREVLKKAAINYEFLATDRERRIQ